MFDLERWQPLRQVPEDSAAAGGSVEGGAEGEVPAAPPSGPGSGRSELRQQLEKNFDTDRKAAEKAEAPAKKGKTPKRVAGGAEIAEPEAAAAGAEAVEGAAEGQGEGEQQPTAVAAPEGLSAEAKAEWEKTPVAVQQAIVKRLADSAKGVEELKTKYTDLDKALQPHMEAIRRVGRSPAEAVSQLFSWFQALQANPTVAFPALAKSFGRDIAEFAGQPKPQPGQEKPAEGAVDPTTQAALPPEVKAYIGQLEGKLGQLEQAFTQKIGSVENALTQQSQAKTDEVLAMWSKDKPHFQEVRELMANLIASGAVPLKEGQVDLDRAYDMAVYASPDVRTKVLAAQQEEQRKAAAAKVAAEKKAQQEQADKARKAAVSIGGSAPGVPGAPGKPTGKRKTVRESIEEARAQVADQ